MEEKISWSTKDKKSIPILETEISDNEYISQLIKPIISNGDTVGTVILFSKDDKTKISDAEEKVISAASGFLGKQMED